MIINYDEFTNLFLLLQSYNDVISGQGTHKKLIALDGDYANLYNKQLKL